MEFFLPFVHMLNFRLLCFKVHIYILHNPTGEGGQGKVERGTDYQYFNFAFGALSFFLFPLVI